MVLKTRIFLPMVVALMSLFPLSKTYGEIKKIDYFSYVSVCGDTVTLMDFEESSRLRNHLVTKNIEALKDENQILEELNLYMQKFNPTLSSEIISTYMSFKKNMIISSGIKISAPAKNDLLLGLEGCQTQPIAASTQVFEGKNLQRNRIIVDKNLWDRITPYEQVAIVLGFALASEIQEENLIPARIFLGYWFSNATLNLSHSEWNKILRHIHFPFYEYNGVKLSFTPSSGATLTIYKTSPLKVGDQTIHICGDIHFYESGNIREVDCALPFPLEIEAGQEISLYAQFSRVNTPPYGRLVFQDTPERKILSALYKTDAPFKYKTHEIHPMNGIPKPKALEINFYPTGEIYNLSISSAKIMIRNKEYAVTNYGPSGYNYPNSFFFYKNGGVSSGGIFSKGMTFDCKKKELYYCQNGRTHTIDHDVTLRFDSEGFITNR